MKKPKQGKSQAPPMARKVSSTGETRDTAMSPVEEQLTKKLAPPRRPNRPGTASAPPVEPIPGQTPLAPRRPVKTPMAIGQRPVMAKTAAKMAKMRGK